MRILLGESSVEMMASLPRTLFFSGSSFRPRNSRPSTIRARRVGEFSPTPAVKTTASRPPMAAAQEPMRLVTL